MKNIKYLFITLFLSSSVILISWTAAHFSPLQPISLNQESDSAAYLQVIKKIKGNHDYISSVCKETADRSICVDKTEQWIINMLYKDIIPHWIGTKWAFYGETQVPGDSSIACGHFVITTLKHLGVLMEDPHQMATNYSAYMVNSLCDTSYKVYKAADMIEIVKSKPRDVWVVGLRNHSGFMVNDNGQIHFIHSSYSMPDSVVDELADSSMTFQGSNIYVAGNLFVGNSLTRKWIRNEKVKYVKKY
jgi:hypothetical protein